MSHLSYLENRRKDISKIKKETKEVSDKIEKICRDISTKKIIYPKYKGSYDYVDALFPECNVKEVIIYKASKKRLQQLGFGRAGGFCHQQSKTVVVSSSEIRSPIRNRGPQKVICAKLKADEVIVHELLHYCKFYLETNLNSKHLQEEFAYGYSVAYLRNKGYSDEEIIKYNFLPYLYEVEEEKLALNIILSEEKIDRSAFVAFGRAKKIRIYRKHIKLIQERVLSASYERGRKIIEIYSKKVKEIKGEYVEKESIKYSSSKFDLLDL